MSVEEALALGKTELGGDLAEGVKAIALNQKITFTRYVRLVLPIDGYVFWVKADLVGPSAMFNSGGFNQSYRAAAVLQDGLAVPSANEPRPVTYNRGPLPKQVAPTIVATGSLHYSTDIRQEEQSTFGANRVVFTSLQEVQDLNEVDPNTLWIGEWDGVRFGFSSRGYFYRQADLFHYVGFAVYSELDTQIVESIRGFDQRQIVSNSLPLWLQFNGYVPFYGFGNPSLVLYPSFVVPQNIVPPYAAVHIVPESTRALSGAPLISRDSSHSQLCAETVRITMFGTRNFSALDFVDCVLQRSLDYEEFGILNMPVVQDQKRTQSELNAIAQKKTVTFEISYVQSRANDVARQLIKRAVPEFIFR